MKQRPFRDRREAGQLLATKLAAYANRPDVLVLALPRGGVPVAYEVARALGAPLDIFLVRKLGVPGYEELAMGAIATGGVRVLNDELVGGLRIPDYIIDEVAASEQQELERRERLYRGDRPAPDVRGRTVILVDDGLATGATMQAAVKALRQQQPARIVVAVPTAAPETCDAVEGGGGRCHLRHHAGAVPCGRSLVRGFLTNDGRRGARFARARFRCRRAEVQQGYPKEEEGHAKHD